MKSIIEFKDGRIEIVEDTMPVCSIDEYPIVGFINVESVCLTDDMPLSFIASIRFEND